MISAADVPVAHQSTALDGDRMYGIPRDDRTTVYWIVPSGAVIRHAITKRPGTVINGERTTALCDAEIKIPFPTLAYRMPKGALVSQRCPGCQVAVDDYARTIQVVWDF